MSAVANIIRLAPAADPALALLEAHRRAFASWLAACERCDEVMARQAGRDVTEADYAMEQAANDAEADALSDLINRPPTTRAGARAVIAWLAVYEADCVPEWSGYYLMTLARSPALAG